MANTYLTRTPSSSSNKKTYTFSAWVKPSSTTSGVLFSCGTDISNGPLFTINFRSDTNIRVEDTISGGTQPINLRTSRLFRDHNAWYHLVVAVDTTQGTASDRVKIYVNGEQETSFTSATYPNQNIDTSVNNNHIHAIGARSTSQSGTYYNGSMSHVHFIDGTAYTPSAFGSTDSVTGEWQINTSPSVTYGTNGFFILKDGNSVTDQSGNGNNFTVGGGTLTNTEDSPSNVFATLNPLHKSLNTDRSFANGNTYVDLGGTARVPEVSNLGMTSGKFYAEMKDINGSGGKSRIGITGEAFRYNDTDWLGSDAYDYGYYSDDGTKANGANETSYGDSWTDGDIIGIAVDLDNLKIYFSKNGVWQNSGDPTSGATGTGAAFTLSSPSSTNDGAYFFACGDDNQYAARRMAWNFGNGYFQTTAVASAGTNASGNGIFEYEVPTGYTALSTKGLNL